MKVSNFGHKNKLDERYLYNQNYLSFCQITILGIYVLYEYVGTYVHNTRQSVANFPLNKSKTCHRSVLLSYVSGSARRCDANTIYVFLNLLNGQLHISIICKETKQLYRCGANYYTCAIWSLCANCIYDFNSKL